MSDRSPRVSAVLPVYNVGAYVAETMRTLLAQDFADFELIVVDDGSTDDTLDIVRTFDDDRIRIVRIDHGGLAVAENAGFAAARAPFVIRVDGDDLYEPTLFGKLVEKAEAHPEAAVVGAWARRFGRPQLTHRPPDDPAKIRRMLRRTWVLSQPTLYRADAVRAVGGFRSVHSEDWDLWIRLARRYDIRVVPEFLAHIRMRPSSMTQDVGRLHARVDQVRMRVRAMRYLGADARSLWKLGTACARVLLYPVAVALRSSSRRSVPEPPRTFSVVIPTVARPQLLARCLAAVEAQSRAPDQIVVVHRADDLETASFVESWIKEDPDRHAAAVVDRPGLVPALACGTEASRGEVVAYLDDDAVPRPGWLEEIERGFRDPTVGAVGGPIVDHVNGVPKDVFATDVGRITWYGRIVWNHDARTEHYGDVDWLTGSNMAIRRELIVHDTRLRHQGNGLALANDLDTTLAVRRAGYRVLYTPWAVVEHHTTSFRDPVLGSRVALADVEASSANHAYALLKTIPWPRRIALHAFGYLVGSASIPGPVRVLVEVPRSPRRALVLARRVPAMWRGRRLGWRMYREWASERAGDR